MLPTITATGNLAADPDLRFTPSGKACANLRLGCNKNKRRDDGSWETISTVWLGITLWGLEAERAVETFRKGQEVTVTGQLSVREYDRNDGTKGTAVEVEFATISLPRIREDRGGQQAQQQPATQQASAWATPTAQQAPATEPWGAPTAPTAPAQQAATQPDMWGQTNPGAEAPPF